MDMKEQLAAQNIMNQMKNNMSQPAPPPISIPQEVCPQCGLVHPLMQPGEVCPMAPIKTKDNKMVDPTNFLTKMKLIISSQLEQKGVKDSEKFFQYLTVELTKLMEAYKE